MRAFFTSGEIMFIFKTRADLHQLPPWHPALPIVTDLLNQIPSGCGYLVLIEEGDDFIDLPEIHGRLVDIAWDGATKIDGHFHAIHLTNNQFGIGFLIPEELGAELKELF
jgi:hypothetical protein